MASPQCVAHGGSSGKVVCGIMLSRGLPMGSDTHKQHGQGGGNTRHCRMRIEPLHVALQAVCGVVITQPTLAALPVYPRFSHAGCLLSIDPSAMTLSLLRPRAWCSSCFSCLAPSYLQSQLLFTSSAMPSLIPKVFKVRI